MHHNCPLCGSTPEDVFLGSVQHINCQQATFHRDPSKPACIMPMCRHDQWEALCELRQTADTARMERPQREDVRNGMIRAFKAHQRAMKLDTSEAWGDERRVTNEFLDMCSAPTRKDG